MHNRSTKALKKHLEIYGIQAASGREQAFFIALRDKFSEIEGKIRELKKTIERSSTDRAAEAFKDTVEQLQLTELTQLNELIQKHGVAADKAKLLKKQTREWMVVEFTRAHFKLQNQILGDDSDFSTSASFTSIASAESEEKPAIGTGIEKLSLLQSIRLTITLRSALESLFLVKSNQQTGKVGFDLSHDAYVLDDGMVKHFGDTIPAELDSNVAASKFKHRHLLSNLGSLSFVDFFKSKQIPTIRKKKDKKSDLTTTAKASKKKFQRPKSVTIVDNHKELDLEIPTEQSGTGFGLLPQSSFFSILRHRLSHDFDKTFYVGDQHEKRNFIHYFLGVPQKKPLTPGWSKFFLAWDILFYAAGMCLIAPLKNIVKLGIEFLPQAAASMFFSLANWMSKKDSVLGEYVFGGLGLLCAGVWLVGRALISPFASLEAAIKTGERLRRDNTVLGWFATILLVGVSAAISLAGVLGIAAVSSIFFPTVAGAVIGEEFAAMVPAVAPPITAAAAGVVVAGDQAMKATAEELFGSTSRMGLLRREKLRKDYWSTASRWDNRSDDSCDDSKKGSKEDSRSPDVFPDRVPDSPKTPSYRSSEDSDSPGRPRPPSLGSRDSLI